MKLFQQFTNTPVLFAAADAGSGGGGAEDDPVDTGDTVEATEGEGDAGDDAGDADGQGAQDEDDDESLIFGKDDDPATDTSRTADERLAALAKAHNKLKRRFGKSWPILKTLKAEGITERELSSLFVKARNFDALADSVGGDLGKLTRALAQDDDPKPKGKGKAAADEDDEDDFDEGKLPWKIENAADKYFARMARDLHESRKTSKALASRIASLEGGLQQDRTLQVQTRWTSARDAAAQHIKNPKQRVMFNDLVNAGFQHAMQNPRKGIQPEHVISHYLKLLEVNPVQAKIAQGAAAQRIAQANATRPKYQAGGSPAGARATKDKTLSDVHRRIRSSVPA